MSIVVESEAVPGPFYAFKFQLRLVVEKRVPRLYMEIYIYIYIYVQVTKVPPPLENRLTEEINL
jgi:hypothetical protein